MMHTALIWIWAIAASIWIALLAYLAFTAWLDHKDRP